MANKELFKFTLSEGALEKGTTKKDGSEGSQFKFHVKSRKLGLDNAAYGSFSKKLLALASKLDEADLFKLEGAPMTITVTVFEPVPINKESIKNNEF